MPCDNHGILIISLDFELHWGMRDHLSVDGFRGRGLETRAAIPRILDLFQEYGIHATWAAVGFLFFDNREDLLEDIPDKLPNYVRSRLSAYSELLSLGRDEEEDPCRFAASLIRRISSTPHQEIGSHTFSHYLCREKGQGIEDFEVDLKAAKKAAQRHQLELKSFVFPRNQVNPEFLPLLSEQGYLCYRGNSRLPSAEKIEDPVQTLWPRLLRLADSYVGFLGFNTYPMKQIVPGPLVNIPASRFLRPYSASLKWLEPLKIGKIRSSLTRAARKGEIFHLWWHPHNFGRHTDENLRNLEKILRHFQKLNRDYQMTSCNMGELASRLEEPKT
ncbi:MAG: polysaccharide deacetylase family protein [Deltaproteobacteria bacterium]|nr:polysaccharide deacetylase family protein [Deltaproteobacteria bacterium]